VPPESASDFALVPVARALQVVRGGVTATGCARLDATIGRARIGRATIGRGVDGGGAGVGRGVGRASVRRSVMIDGRCGFGVCAAAGACTNGKNNAWTKTESPIARKTTRDGRRRKAFMHARTPVAQPRDAGPRLGGRHGLDYARDEFDRGRFRCDRGCRGRAARIDDFGLDVLHGGFGDDA